MEVSDTSTNDELTIIKAWPSGNYLYRQSVATTVGMIINVRID